MSFYIAFQSLLSDVFFNQVPEMMAFIGIMPIRFVEAVELSRFLCVS